MPPPSPAPERDFPRDFHTTRWSLVLRAGGDAEPASSAAALETLCRAYWYPLHAYVRRRGYGPEEARDLTQGFFEALLTKTWSGTRSRSAANSARSCSGRSITFSSTNGTSHAG